MKVVVIGLGAMGRRRIRLMQAMPDGFEIVGVNRSAGLYDDVVQDSRYNANIVENAYADEVLRAGPFAIPAEI